jgi:hypothetical protein
MARSARALLMVLRWRPNTAWLVLASAAIGIAHAHALA